MQLWRDKNCIELRDKNRLCKRAFRFSDIVTEKILKQVCTQAILSRNPMQFLSRRSCIKFRTCSKLQRYLGDFMASSLCACKLAAILWRFYRRDIAGDFMQLRRDKNCIELRDKKLLCKRPLRHFRLKFVSLNLCGKISQSTNQLFIFTRTGHELVNAPKKFIERTNGRFVG